MSKVWTIVRHEVFVTMRRKGYLFITFGVPIIAVVALVMFIQLQSTQEDGESQDPLDRLPDKPIGYVDHSGFFSETGALTGVVVRYLDESAARNALKNAELSSFYIIAPDYLETGQVTRRALQLGFGGSDFDVFRAFLILQLLGDENPNLLLRLHTPVRVIEHQLDTASIELSQADEEEQYGRNFVLVYGFAMILMLSTFIPAGYLLRSVIEEKENRTIEVVLSSLRPMQLLAGKVLGQGAMGLLQVLIWLASSWVLVNLASGGVPGFGGIDLPLSSILIVVLFFLANFFLVACFQAGLGAISANMREGPQYAAFFTLPTVAPLWLLNAFIEKPNGSLAVILSLIPITAPLSMVQRIAISAVPWWQVCFSLSLLALSILLTLWLASKIFRVNTLLAGTMPKFVDLIRLLREA